MQWALDGFTVNAAFRQRRLGVCTGIADGKQGSLDVEYGNSWIFDSFHFTWT
jgi:hypothetical protein